MDKMITRNNLPKNLTYRILTSEGVNRVFCVCGKSVEAPILDKTWVEIPRGRTESPYQKMIQDFINLHENCG